MEEGYLQEAIINYIALLGWSARQEREVFSLDELVDMFDIEGIVKTNAIFDYKKLDWFNAIYISKMTHEEFVAYSQKYLNDLPSFIKEKWEFASTLAQSRISKFSDIGSMFEFLNNYAEFDLSLFENKKNKLDRPQSLNILQDMFDILSNTQDWSVENLNAVISDYTTLKEFKIGKTMWPIRIAVTGQVVTPGGGAEMLYLLGKDESLKRIGSCIERLKA